MGGGDQHALGRKPAFARRLPFHLIEQFTGHHQRVDDRDGHSQASIVEHERPRHQRRLQPLTASGQEAAAQNHRQCPGGDVDLMRAGSEHVGRPGSAGDKQRHSDYLPHRAPPG